ncbi:MAG: malate synthase A [Chloroflexi bacterium UTCFX4]|nr:MAG: malate synthase A [Chloroflexi bacterium UTCFX4]
MSHPFIPDGVELRGALDAAGEQVLTADALKFIAALQREFNQRRLQALQERAARQARIDAGEDPTFLAETESVRNDPTWQVAPIPDALQRRHIEITGPTDAKMLINALNSGADMFMADFEDANAPTWHNMLHGQRNLTDAIEGVIFLKTPEKEYKLNEKVATLLVRPRGWHLEEKHMLVDGRAMSGSLFDFGLYFFHNARRLLDKGKGPYFYLPKLESRLEARLWNDVFVFAQNYVELPQGTIKVTVLVETILAAFEMEEILYELRDHIAGLNAGRWDYIFSCIKKFRARQNVVFPDRAQVTMTVPFMRAYTELLVRTCHKRGAHAMGGMAAYIPSRKDPLVNENALAKVREDKLRESQDGFDGTWIAHPDLVPTVRAVFDAALGAKPHQKERMREEVAVTAAQLIDFKVPGGTITEAGVRNNISVAIQYTEAWLRGNGAVALNNLMEDAATAEIARSQVWQWLHHDGVLDDGRQVTPELYRALLDDEIEKIKRAWGEANVSKSRLAEAALLFDKLVTAEQLSDFLTLPAYQYLD